MKYISKLVGYGFLTWLVPFVVSFAFFDVKTQELVISEVFFKTIMVVTGALVGTVLLVMYFRKVEKRFLWQGFLVGVVWLLINWGLDLLMVWRGFFDMGYVQYFEEIGLRYLSILIYSVGVGYVLQVKSLKLKVESEEKEEE
jgi:Na+/proline symporter